MPSVLITGGSGLVAGALARRLAGAGWRVRTTTRRRDEAHADRPFLDLADGETAGEGLPRVDAVVLAAAVARLGDCEADPAGTRRCNVAGNLAVAKRAAAAGAHVLLLSSDKVFDGTRPFRGRDEATCPVGEYGRQKAAGEAGVLRLGAAGAVLRLSKVLAPELGLLAGWAANLRAGGTVDAFVDMHLAPVDTDLVAALVLRLLHDRPSGVWHCSGAEERSYAELARGLARRLGTDPALVRAVAADPTLMPPRNRPPHSTLDMSQETRRWGVAAPAFDELLDRLASAL